MTPSEIFPRLILLQQIDDASLASPNGRHQLDNQSEGMRLRINIPEDVLEHYGSLRARKKRAIAEVVNGTCRACNLAVPRGFLQQLRSAAELSTCPNCFAYIYLNSEELTLALLRLSPPQLRLSYSSR